MQLKAWFLAVCTLAFGASQAAPITYNPGLYTFTALTAGDYGISVQGAQGGGARGGVNGGFGADASAIFDLFAGEQLSIVVGSVGQYNGSTGSGGGGSFVYVTATNLLLLAGGGGGGATNVTGFGGSPSNGGNASTSSTLLLEQSGAVAGVNGQGGACCGPNSHAGSGGFSFVDSSSPDGYAGSSILALATDGGAGLVTITAPAAAPASVPEPMSLALIGAGVFVGARSRRKHRSALAL